MSRVSQPYQPPYVITTEIVNKVADISRLVGSLEALTQDVPLRLRRINQIKSIHGSLAIEGNTLTEAQITAILDGKPVLAPPREILEVTNARSVYDRFADVDPYRQADLLQAHKCLMDGLVVQAGQYRSSGVGVMAGEKVIHMAPPAMRVPFLMDDLFTWLTTTKEHPLVASCVFHYEFEFIHPFADGNGRMGRLWQNVILANWAPAFAHIPVESLVLDRQGDYYEAIRQSTKATDSGVFVAFMLELIEKALVAFTPQATPKLPPPSSGIT